MGNKVIVTRSKLDLLADSISAKSGEALPLTIGEMKIAVDGIVLNSYTIGDGDLNVDENDYLYFDDEGEMVLGTKTITENGTYNASSDSLSGYSSVTVNVAGGSSVQTQTKTATPTESQQTISPDSGYLLSSVTVNAISSTYVGSGIDQNDSDDLTVSGATVTAPAGYYATAASKSVASGTAGTPSASKGTVSNHSITVTPSVTNTAGYITGGTKTGTAVTVSASELVSGSETKTANGTYDVTNIAELVINVSSGGGSPIASGTFTPETNSKTFTITVPSDITNFIFYSTDFNTGEDGAGWHCVGGGWLNSCGFSFCRYNNANSLWGSGTVTLNGTTLTFTAAYNLRTAKTYKWYAW